MAALLSQLTYASGNQFHASSPSPDLLATALSKNFTDNVHNVTRVVLSFAPRGGVLYTLLFNLVLSLLALVVFCAVLKRLPLFNQKKVKYGDVVTIAIGEEESHDKDTQDQRQQFKYLYQLRGLLVEIGEALQALFVPAKFREDIQKFWALHGRDVAVYMLFQKIFLIVLIIITILGIVVLLPIHMTGKPPMYENKSLGSNNYNNTGTPAASTMIHHDGIAATLPYQQLLQMDFGDDNDDDKDNSTDLAHKYYQVENYPLLRTSVAMVLAEPVRLYAHVICAFVFTSCFLLALFFFNRSHVVQKYFNRYAMEGTATATTTTTTTTTTTGMEPVGDGSGSEYGSTTTMALPTADIMVSKHAVMVYDLPKDFVDEKALLQIFEKLYSKERILSATIIMDMKKRLTLQRQLERVQRELDHYEAVQYVKNRREKITIFHSDISYKDLLTCSIYNRVDAIQHFQTQKIFLESCIAKLDRGMEIHEDLEITSHTGNSSVVDQVMVPDDEPSTGCGDPSSTSDPATTTATAPKASASSGTRTSNLKAAQQKKGLKGTGFGFVIFRYAEDAADCRRRYSQEPLKYTLKKIKRRVQRDIVRTKESIASGLHHGFQPMGRPGGSPLPPGDRGRRASSNATTATSAHVPAADATTVDHNIQIQVRRAREPDDYIWENMCVNEHKKRATNWAVVLCMCFICMFLTTPLALLSGIQSIALSPRVNGFVRTLRSLTRNHGNFIFQYLPTLSLYIISALVPMLITFLTERIEKFKSKSKTRRTVLIRLYVYLVLSTLIMPSMFLTSMDGIVKYLLDRDLERMINKMFLPESGAFFINFILQLAFVKNILEDLIRVPDIIRYLYRRRRAVTDEEKREAPRVARFTFEYEYAAMIAVLAIVLTYSTLSPIILPCGLLFLLLKHLVDRHNILYVCSPEDLNPHHDFAAHSKRLHLISRLVLVNVLIFQFAMVVFFGSKIESAPGYAPHTILMCLLFIATLAYTIVVSTVLRDHPRINCFKLEEAQTTGKEGSAASSSTEEEMVASLLKEDGNSASAIMIEVNGAGAVAGRKLEGGTTARSKPDYRRPLPEVYARAYEPPYSVPCTAIAGTFGRPSPPVTPRMGGIALTTVTIAQGTSGDVVYEQTAEDLNNNNIGSALVTSYSMNSFASSSVVGEGISRSTTREFIADAVLDADHDGEEDEEGDGEQGGEDKTTKRFKHKDLPSDFPEYFNFVKN